MPRKVNTRKSARDYTGPRRTTATGIIFNGKPAGCIVVAHGPGSAVATITVYAGPLAFDRSATGKSATGGGYCKASAAVAYAAAEQGGPIGKAIGHLDGCGMPTIDGVFVSFGYVVHPIL